MARINSASNDKVYQINKFLGINQNSDGDANIRMGEASEMTNFCITRNRSLQIRKGSKNIAGLLSAYTITVSDTATAVVVDDYSPTSTFTAYPNISVSAGGVLALSGTSVSVTYANIATYAGYYWQNATTGAIYQIGTTTIQPITSGATAVTGGYVSISGNITNLGLSRSKSYADVSISSYAVTPSGTESSGPSVNNYMNIGGSVYKIRSLVYNDGGNGYYEIDGYLVSNATQYAWNFYAVTATTNSTDTEVRGIWSGLVGCVEYIVAACNGFLWSLSETGGVWTKTSIGAISTTAHVLMFGFDSKLYIIDGTQYFVWNGTTLSTVAGYRPLILTATTPTGTGTALEQVNKLNGLRRVRFSSTGGTTFQLPETGLTSIDYVKYVATGTAIATTTLNVTTGLVTTTAATTAGTNNIEIGYTFPTTYRAAVIGMKFSETFNGETDTRIFLYGDGSNKAFYSGIQNDTGKPSAEYFPDLNEIAVDASNTPITSMIKHYDSLLTFKNDGAFITRYGTITNSDNSTIAAFYTTPLNREIGNVAIGQAVLIRNNPFTLYGRSVYEWKLSSFSSKDERNAEPKSDRAATALSGMDLTKAICFDDEFNNEYYICENSKVVVYNYEVDAWYCYDNLPITCMITYKQEVYFGDTAGYIRHFSRDYMNDNGTDISAYWESGSMDFGAGFKRKYSPCLWLGIKPEEYGEIVVTVKTDRQTDLSAETSASNYTETSASGFFNFLDLDFTRLSFNVNSNPQTDKLKIKAKKFTYYKLIFSSVSDNTTATITNAYIDVRYTGNVR